MSPLPGVPGLAWGTTTLALPAAWADVPVLDAPGLPPAPDPGRAWDGACREAAGRVAGHAGSRGRVCLVVPDRTRALPLPTLLPSLFAALDAAGVAPGRVTVVPASGLHRPMTLPELGGWTGLAPGGPALLAPHDADAPAVLLGRTADGLPVAAHPAAAHAAAILAVGRIVFHYLAGFGGGRKMLVPGVAARRTILAVHGRCLDPRPGAGRHAAARTGRLAGNPVHGAACAAAALFPPATGLHVLLTPGGALHRADAGDLVGDHARAAADYAAANEAVIDAPLDAVVVSAGGHPTDRDLVQAHKALEAVAPVVKDGGTIVFVARCADGVGNPELGEGLARGGTREIEASLRRRFRVGGHTALALRAKTARFEVLAVTDLPDDALALAGLHRVATLDEAAGVVAARHGSGARIAVAPRGGAIAYRVTG